MTPKEQYEARKAARKLDDNEKDAEVMDMVDRFVTAVERIADALEKANL